MPTGEEGDPIDISQELESWYQRDNGAYLLEATRRHLQEALAVSFGYHILQLGLTGGHPMFDHSRINHRVYASERRGEGVTLVCRGDELPLESDSIDAAIVHHGLEFAENPHQVLREVQRVLTPQGQLLVIGFNPWSLQGVATRLRGLSSRSAWSQQRFVSAARLTDWLHLLGCEVQSSTRLHHLPLIGSGRLRDAIARANRWCDQHNLPTGSVYMVHAVKQVSGINRTRRPLREARQRLIGLAVPKPAAAPSPTPVVPTPCQGAPGRGDVAA